MIPEAPIQSPCIRHCCLDEDDICVGCFRSLPEVVSWADADNATRQQILDKSKDRQIAYQEKYRRLS